MTTRLALTLAWALAAPAPGAPAVPKAEPGATAATAARADEPDRPEPRPLFVDVTEEAGLAFRHHAAHTPAHLYPETFGAGVALLDLEGDGDLDVLLLDTGPPPGSPSRATRRHALLRNVSRHGGPIRLEPAPAPDLGEIAAMGACVGDVDGDGDDDVHVTGLPRGQLLLNRDGRLVPAEGDAGVDDPGWSTSCAFLDHDRDGDLDLYVAHYVAWSAEAEHRCGGEVAGVFSYCPPSRYEAEADRLFEGDGRGGFEDVSSSSGLAERPGKGLGVVAADLDEDGWIDVYVANDQVPNHLLLGSATGFREAALLAGVALSEEGAEQAGMGVDAADVDGDGRLDLTVANLDLETNNLYLGLPASAGARTPRFRDAVHEAGLAAPTLMSLGFGTLFVDVDLDSDLDVFVVNGHVLPEIALLRADQTWPMEDQLFENVAGPGGARFHDARARWLPAASRADVSRGLATGDLDDDGDLDLVVTANGGPARLLAGTAADSGAAPWLGVRLAATRSAPGAPGARVVLEGAGPPIVRVRRAGGSYLSASDPRVRFGLGGRATSAMRARVTWPSGTCEVHGPLEAGRDHELTEGKGRACGATEASRPEPETRSEP